jgi:trehalose synthase
MLERHKIRVEDYEPLIGGEAVERILRKAEPLRGLHVTNINSTYYGGGVAEILSSLTLLMNSAGIHTGWRAIHGPPDFFGITKKMHNALQGGDINLTEMKLHIYEEVVRENSIRNHLHHDIVMVHDPQPLPLVHHYRKRGPWIWRCHLDMSSPNAQLWDYLKPTIESYDAVILSLPEYAQQLQTPQVFFMPAIDPFSIKNRDMSDAEVDERLSHYGIPTDLPLVVQISRFDRWKDPEGVIAACKLAWRKADFRLVLLGNVASDDPEGEEVFETLLSAKDDRTIIMSHEDTALVNALQRRAALVMQKSIREGFGLTVSEALWKGTPVIGGNVGGIRHQIRDGENGFLVSSIEEAAKRIVQLVQNVELRERLGRAGRETVARQFLLTRLMEQEVELFSSFESSFKLRPNSIP